MNEIKTDLFPEVLRTKAKNRRENGEKDKREKGNIQSNAVKAAEIAAASDGQEETKK